MSANNSQYMQLFGAIINEASMMAKCACVSCYTCVGPYNHPDAEDIEW